MSCNETKKVIRAEIPWLRGKGTNDAYQFFRSILGPADEIDGDESEVFYFYYESDCYTFYPVREYYQGKTKNDRWGVEFLLFMEDDFGNRVGKEEYTHSEIEQIIAAMSEKFGVKNTDCKTYQYTWYNGTDEPIIFKK